MAAPGMHARSLLRPAFVLPLAWLAATLVNVTKAVHMDDSTYLILARQILQDPLHPLAGTIVLSGETWPAASVNQPPLLLYGFAAVMAAFGESELALHLFVSIFSAAALLLFHALARRLCPRHALALTLAFVLGPAFLPGQNLMMDVPLVALWLAFFWLLLCGGETRAPRYVAAAAVAGAACLVKYTSLVLVPLLLIPVIVRREERYAGVVAIPIAVLAAWSLWNLLDYGEVHLFTRVAHAGEHSPLLGRAEAWLECLGGVAPFSIALAPLFARHRHALSLLAGSSALVGLLYYGSLGAESGPTPVFKAVFLTNGLLVTLVAGAALRPRPGERREDAALLGGWLVAGTLFPVLLAPFMAVRHVLPVIPALLLVLGRWIEGPGAARWARVGVGLSVLLGVALAVADWQYADVFRTQAGALRERFGAQARLWHLGGWGWRWYAEAHGMEPYLNDSSVLRAGDLVLIPQATAGPNGVARRDQPRVRLIDVVEPLPPSWLLPRIMLPFPRGGYYAVGSEGLPWTFSRTPLERILVFRVGEERRAAPGRPR
jgi:4-amino-4-deoxy-L-arabinose transferase-like glycosyltransferase